MKKAISIVLVCVILVFGLVPAAHSTEELLDSDSKTPRLNGQNAVYRLGACVTQSELDCIEEFGVIEKGQDDDVFIPGVQTFYDHSLRSKGQHERPVFGSETNWDIPTSQGTIKMRLNVELMSNKTQIGDSKSQVGGALSAFIHGREQDLETRFFVKVRTSWFKPENFTLHANNAGFSQQKIKGGNLWTLSGARVLSAGYKFINREQFAKALASKAPADYESSNLHFLGHHIMDGNKPSTSFFNNPCSSKGYMVQANNAPGGGMAYWDNETKSLNFSIVAAHRTMDGKLNRGFYRMWVNRDYIECMWPESGLAKAKGFKVGVYNEDGTKQVATTLVSINKDVLTVAALNFHYSSPSIRVSRAKKTLVHCLNLSSSLEVKKVRGKKCPNGFKPFD